MTKSEIRKLIRAQRNSLSVEYRDKAAKKCLETIISNNLLINLSHIAVYLPNDCELDLTYLIKYCWENNINCYLPVVEDTIKLPHDSCQSKVLSFVKYNSDSKLKINKYNILEPELLSEHKKLNITNQHNIGLDNSFINPTDIDLVFVPLVAFTKSGQRLGMGGGYYDQTFAFLANSSNNNNKSGIKKPKLIGAAYELQCVDALPIESWDINLDGIVTETKFITTQ